MDSLVPPPLIDCARVLHFANAEQLVHLAERQRLYVKGGKLGAVPRLAIAKNLIDDGILLLHCDAEWTCLGASDYADIEKAFAAANSFYEGLSARWTPSPYCEIDIAKAVGDMYRDQRCSFCRRYHFELGTASMIGGTDAAICSHCIVSLYETIKMANSDADMVG